MARPTAPKDCRPGAHPAACIASYGRLAPCPRRNKKRAPDGSEDPWARPPIPRRGDGHGNAASQNQRLGRAVTPRGISASLPSVPLDAHALPRRAPRDAVGRRAEDHTKPCRSSDVHALRASDSMRCAMCKHNSRCVGSGEHLAKRPALMGCISSSSATPRRACWSAATHLRRGLRSQRPSTRR